MTLVSSTNPLVTPYFIPPPVQITDAAIFGADPLLEIKPDVIDQVGGFTREGTIVYNLGKGVPGEAPPTKLLNVQAPALGYSPQGGLPQLREQIAAYLNQKYQPQKPVTAANVLVTPGNQPGLALAAEILRSATVYIEAPFYSQFRWPIRLGEHHMYTIDAGAGEQPLASARAIGNILSQVGAPVLWTSNPRNPDGAVRYGDDLAAVYAAVAGAGGVFVSDEAYSSFTMGVPEGHSTSLLSVLKDIEKARALILHTASKNFFAPGARIGWIVGPSSWISKLVDLTESHTTPPSLYSQLGLLHLLSDAQALGDHEENLVRTYTDKRKRFLEALKEIPDLTLQGNPLGAFFVSAELDSSVPTEDAYHFSRRLAYEEGVSTIPLGYAGPRFNRQLRLSYGANWADIQEALNRLKGFIARIKLV